MHLFYNNTKLFALALTVFNIVLHTAGFFFGIDLENLLITFFSTQLTLVSLLMIMVIYKWIRDDFQNLKTEQTNILSEIENSKKQSDDRIDNAVDSFKEKINELNQNTSNLITSNTETLAQAFDMLRKQSEILKKISHSNDSTLFSLSDLETKILNRLHSHEEKNLDIINNHLNTLLKETRTIQNNMRQNEELYKTKLTISESVLSENINKLKNFISEKSLNLTDKTQELFDSSISKIEHENFKNITEINKLKIRISKDLISSLEQLDSSINENKSFFNNLEVNLFNNLEGTESKVLSLITSEYNDQKKHNDFKLVKELETIYDRIDALISIHSTLEFQAPFPIMHEWTISSDFAHETLTTLLKSGKGSVIDIGSGVSTILYGYATKKNGAGKVISLEHSKNYFEKTKDLIIAHKLESYCEVHFCPLIEYDIEGEKWLWYDISDVTFPKEVALISVDGPPGNTQLMARYPAIPILKKNITEQTTIYLDDAYRNEEAQIAKKWESKFDLTSKLIKSHKGIFHLVLNGKNK